jgi:hypothetical protein
MALMTERNVMAVVTDLVKSGLSVEQTILVNELVMLTASLQAEADRRETDREYERERKRAYRMSRDVPGCPRKERKVSTPSKERNLYNNIPNPSNHGSRAEGTNPRALGTNPRATPAPWMPSFEQFWEIFPRRVGKGTAKKAFKHAAERASFAEILDGARRYAKECVGRETQYIKHPSTWLNADCWLDEPERKPSANVVGFRKEFKPEPEGPKVSEEERQANLAKLAALKFGGKKL